jgi:hypothetical protein
LLSMGFPKDMEIAPGPIRTFPGQDRTGVASATVKSRHLPWVQLGARWDGKGWVKA